MKRALAVLALFLFTGCERHHDRPTTGLLPHTCSYAVSKLDGALQAGTGTGQTRRFNVPVPINPVDGSDYVDVSICKHAPDCRANLPARTCGQTGDDGVTPCFTTTPSPHITTTTSSVSFINAFEDGYTTYAIDAYACQ